MSRSINGAENQQLENAAAGASASTPPGIVAQLGAKDGETGQPTGPAIAIKPWDPNTPYLAAMKTAGPDASYNTYLKQRKDFTAAPAFYLDCADYLLQNNHRDLGVRVLTDIPALKLESPELLRIAAARLRQIGEFDLAVDLYEKTLAMRAEEPQSYRDLALALADRAGSVDPASTDSAALDRAATDYSRSLDLLNQVVLRQPDQRFPGVEVIAMEEANRIIAQAAALGKNHAITNPIDPRLLKLMDLDLRVIMSWDTPDTDIDLWVTEPSGEKCMYNHNRTTIGGMLSNDITQGYGPEEYNLRKAMPGTYNIQANFYGSHSQALMGPTTIHATVITHWGRPDEKRQSLTVRLTDNKEVVDLGLVTVKP
jgi:tetratricopeptide (TPR) repeat protein